MPTRNVVLTDHQHKVIEDLVESGRYQNASEILRDGLRLVEKREAEDSARLEALREAAQLGWRDLEAGRYQDVRQESLTDHVEQIGSRAGDRARAKS